MLRVLQSRVQLLVGRMGSLASRLVQGADTDPTRRWVAGDVVQLRAWVHVWWGGWCIPCVRSNAWVDADGVDLLLACDSST